MKNMPNLCRLYSKGVEIVSKIYDLLGAIISKLTNAANAIPKKLSELENDAGFITEQKQSDWNQNNPEAADYVKNRPFYTGDLVETVLVEETTNEWTAAGFDGALALAPIDLVEGETYVVMFDGVKYECIAYIAAGPNFPPLGDGSIVGAGNGGSNGEQFYIEHIVLVR